MRHRLVERVYIVGKDRTWKPAMSFEISAGRMSLVTMAELEVGQHVGLWPAAGAEVEAIVRRKKATMYGFEFMGLKPEVREMCAKLPLFQSTVEI